MAGDARPVVTIQAAPRAGARNWTLLVNGVNHYSAPAERLLRRFSFIPQARLDDVMVSYAAPGGGVGPHFDSYDVFLIQGAGRRVWRLARPRPFALVPDAPLSLIDDFRAEEEYVLEPGDLLYLPPGWGHDGVALDACFTYSVGFRAPRGAELAAAFLDYLHERGLPDADYRDPGLRRRGTAGADRRRTLIAFAEAQLARIRWTRARRGRISRALPEHAEAEYRFHAFEAESKPAIAQQDQSYCDPKTQMLYLGARFFINGEVLRAAREPAARAGGTRRPAPRAGPPACPRGTRASNLGLASIAATCRSNPRP